MKRLKSTPIARLESEEATALDTNNFENQDWLLKDGIMKKRRYYLLSVSGILALCILLMEVYSFRLKIEI